MAEEANPKTLSDVDPLRPSLPARAIMAIVAAEFRMPLRNLISTRRSLVIVRPRQTAMWLLSRHTPSSLPQIGRHFGGFDHTTVLHALRRVDEWRESDPTFAGRLRQLQVEISAAEARLSQAGTVRVSVREEAPPAVKPSPAEPPVPMLMAQRPTSLESRVTEAVGVYLSARAELEKCQWSKGERAAHAKVDAAFQALSTAYRGDEPVTRRRSA